MTLNIIISLTILGWLLWHSLSIQNIENSHSKISWLPLAILIVLVLPFTFGGFVVISNFVFEFSSDNITWFIIVFSLLWVASAVCIYRCKLLKARSLTQMVHWAVWLSVGFWASLAATQSQYEPGAVTPRVTESVITMAHLLIAHVVILLLFAQLLFSNFYFRKWDRFTASFLLIGIYSCVVIIPFWLLN